MADVPESKSERKLSLPSVEEPPSDEIAFASSQRGELTRLQSPTSQQHELLHQASTKEEQIKAQERERRKARKREPRNTENASNGISHEEQQRQSRFNASLEDIEHHEMDDARIKAQEQEQDLRVSSKSKKWLLPQTSRQHKHQQKKQHSDSQKLSRSPLSSNTNGTTTTRDIASDHRIVEKTTARNNRTHNSTPSAQLLVERRIEDRKAKERANRYRHHHHHSHTSSGDDSDLVKTNQASRSNPMEDVEAGFVDSDTDHAVVFDDDDDQIKEPRKGSMGSDQYSKGDNFSYHRRKSNGSLFDPEKSFGSDGDDSSHKYTGIVPVGAVAVDGDDGERFLAKASLYPLHPAKDDDDNTPRSPTSTDNANANNMKHHDSSDSPQELFKKELPPSSSWWATRQCKIVFGVVLVAVVIIVSAVVAIGSGGGNGGSDDDIDDEERTNFLKETLYDLSGDTLYDPSTPQHMAYEWIVKKDTQISTLNTNPSKIKARYTLAAFYYSTGGNTTWSNPQNWLNTEMDECDWAPKEADCFGGQDMFGFYFDEGSFGLSGAFPKELVDLNLVELSIQYEDDVFAGVIDPVVYDMVSLSYLQLSGLSLVGSIPSDLSKLTNLEAFVAEDNDFDGSIPSDLYKLKKMQTLRLGRNEIETNMTEFIIGISTTMEDLAILELFGNRIYGSIPSEIAGLSELEHLNIQNNLNLAGPIPAEIGMLTKLSFFSFVVTDLSGDVPVEVCSVGILDLQCNLDVCDCEPSNICSEEKCCTSCSEL